MENEPKNEWHGALQKEDQLRKKIVLLRGKPDWKVSRAWWASVETVLRLYLDLWERGERPAPPAGLLWILAQFFEDLSVGKVPDPIAHVAKGAPGIGPEERYDIQIAVTYLKAANGGLDNCGHRIEIVDPHPTQTIAEAYGVHRRTVQGWANKFGPLVFDETIDAEFLIDRMNKAARGYSRWGRSRSAVEHRGANRTRGVRRA